MISINIKNSFLLDIDTLEFEDVLPSLKILLKFKALVNAKKTLDINNEVWIACKAWDVFLGNLMKLDTDELHESNLEDLSGNSLIKISKVNESFIVHFIFLRQKTSGVKINCDVNVLIEREDFFNVMEKLNEFNS